MLLNVIARPGDAFAAMRHLLEDNHEPRARAAPAHPPRHRDLPRRCARPASSSSCPSRTPRAGACASTVDLQLDFALNQPLSPFALAALELLDRESPDYALDVLSVIEATLDDPRQVLYAQQNKARGEAVARDEGRGHRVRGADGAARGRHLAQAARRAARPARFEIYRRGHPWVADARCRPSRWCATCTSGR